jgi:hypothetical protein
MPLTQAHYLLMLAEDAASRGDDISDEWRRKATAHYQEVHELSILIERARELVAREKARFQQYAPQPQDEPLPRIVRPQVPQKKAE